MTQPVFRFAPSPNGALHLGHAFSALQNEAEARRLKGRLLLRIEDIDKLRCRPEFERAIVKDLRWLGIDFEEAPRRQSEHMEVYRSALSQLLQMGLVYPCSCSRSAIKAAAGEDGPRDPDGSLLYPGTCRGQPPRGPVAAMRLDMQAALEAAGGDLGFVRFWPDGREERVEARPQRWGDVVLARKDTPTSYHLSVVTDDALQGVSHVVRGEDLEAQTDIHVLLQRLLGLPTPRYQFHKLLLDQDGGKLSKSRGSASLADLRAAGGTPADVRRRLGF
jgi:glutamyl-Q tRNA(Asp) synthetase